MTKKQMLNRYKKIDTLSKLLKQAIEKQPENLTLIRVLLFALRNYTDDFKGAIEDSIIDAGKPLKQIKIKF